MTEVATGRRFQRWPWFSLENQEGITRCLHCNRWERNGNFAETGEQFEEHLRKDHPDIKPRSREQILQELQGKKRREREEEERRARNVLREARPETPRPRYPSGVRRKPGPKSSQPNLTDLMIEEMKRLYGEMGSIRRVAEHCYLSFGFSSAERLKHVLRQARKERGVILGIPRNRRRITNETVKEILRLFKEEGLSVQETARRLCQSCGYSFNGFRNVVYDILEKKGIDSRVNSKRVGGSKRKMTPARIEVAWQLYSVGNYTLEEISELSKKFWDNVHENTIGDNLKKAGHKLRVGRWGRDGSRPISQEEALKLIKSVSEF